MEPLRLLHIADAHLDTPFYGREEALRRKLRDACRQAFSQALEEAIERNVHALLIAGDLFDNDRLSFTTERFLLEAMGRLREAGIAVFYATGNHDPGRAGYRAHQLGWPDNVYLFTKAQPETVAITDRQGTQLGWLTAAGHSSRREEKNLAARYGQARNELPHIALLHAQVISARGAEYHDRYAPCTEEDLSTGGFDYWALAWIIHKE
jgi:exonuclease SbcD